MIAGLEAKLKTAYTHKTDFQAHMDNFKSKLLSRANVEDDEVENSVIMAEQANVESLAKEKLKAMNDELLATKRTLDQITELHTTAGRRLLCNEHFVDTGSRICSRRVALIGPKGTKTREDDDIESRNQAAHWGHVLAVIEIFQQKLLPEFNKPRSEKAFGFLVDPYPSNNGEEPKPLTILKTTHNFRIIINLRATRVVMGAFTNRTFDHHSIRRFQTLEAECDTILQPMRDNSPAFQAFDKDARIKSVIRDLKIIGFRVRR